jgi:hypothetical protein
LRERGNRGNQQEKADVCLHGQWRK